MSETRPDVHSLNVRAVVPETPDSISIVFDVGADRLDYAPGQFLTIRVPGAAGPVARCYSLSSAPCVDAHPAITVKRTDSGYASNWLCDNVVAGVTVDSLAPAGAFVPTRWDADFLLVAGGSGITPVLSILKTALHEHRNRVTLLYANRDEQSVIFADQLADLERRYPQRLEVVHWLESDAGLPSVAGLQRRVRPTPDARVYLCGPGAFMSVVEEYLQVEGVDRDRIHKEVFVSLSTDAFEVAAIEVTADPDAATVIAAVDGAEHRLAWPKQTPLLDVMLAAGLEPDYACREGSCGACAYTLRRGEVKMLANDTLDSYELGKGVRLACQSLPLSDELHVAFDQ